MQYIQGGLVPHDEHPIDVLTAGQDGDDRGGSLGRRIKLEREEANVGPLPAHVLAEGDLALRRREKLDLVGNDGYRAVPGDVRREKTGSDLAEAEIV